ncbi:MAG TPA: hypothetical protein VF947_05935 [Myxococcales bacterium]
MEIANVDRWVRQLIFAALLLAALGLLVTGLTLYAPGTQSRPQAQPRVEKSQCENGLRVESRTWVEHDET